MKFQTYNVFREKFSNSETSDKDKSISVCEFLTIPLPCNKSQMLRYVGHPIKSHMLITAVTAQCSTYSNRVSVSIHIHDIKTVLTSSLLYDKGRLCAL